MSVFVQSATRAEVTLEAAPNWPVQALRHPATVLQILAYTVSLMVLALSHVRSPLLSRIISVLVMMLQLSVVETGGGVGVVVQVPSESSVCMNLNLMAMLDDDVNVRCICIGAGMFLDFQRY